MNVSYHLPKTARPFLGACCYSFSASTVSNMTILPFPPSTSATPLRLLPCRDYSKDRAKKIFLPKAEDKDRALQKLGAGCPLHSSGPCLVPLSRENSHQRRHTGRMSRRISRALSTTSSTKRPLEEDVYRLDVGFTVFLLVVTHKPMAFRKNEKRSMWIPLVCWRSSSLRERSGS